MKNIVIFSVFSLVIVALLTGCSSHPKVSLEKIQKDIVGKNTGEGIMSWTFEKHEPREISVVESKYDGDKATIIIEMKTKGGLVGRSLAGKLRLYYEWIANEWNLIRVEKLSFKQI